MSGPAGTVADRVAAAVDRLVASGDLAGAATVVWRDGTVVQAGGVGWRDVGSGRPVERDTIFRIASMTKPVTSVAALTLLEEGRFSLADAITRWAPEFADARVVRSTSGPLDVTDPAERPITMGDLLTHRSGLTYGELWPGPLAAAHEELGGAIDSDLTPDEWIATLASIPLVAQPGAGFHYGHSTDLLGLLLARMTGTSLGEVLRRQVLAPLGMVDTGFTVPAGDADRQARLYGVDDAGRPAPLLTAPGGATLEHRPPDMTFESGGQGLWSTVDDYLRFARLFLGEGAVDGVRVLQPRTLALMTRDHLTAEQRREAELLGGRPFAQGHGFGLGVAVVTDSTRADPLVCGGSPGSVGWPGAYGGWWRADPVDGSVLVLLTHCLVTPEQLAAGVGFGAYEARLEFQEAAAR